MVFPVAVSPSCSGAHALRAPRRARQARVVAPVSQYASPNAYELDGDNLFSWPGRAVQPEEYTRLGSGGVTKKFSLLGSTGSIGTQTLDIVEEHPDKFEIVALSAGRNIDVLAGQILKFRPSLVGIQDESKLSDLKSLLSSKGMDVADFPQFEVGEAGAVAVATHPEANAVVTGIVGCAGLQPTVAAIEKGKDICLANKETLIAGGPTILPLVKKYGVNILPADSEHSAIFQCIQGLPENGMRRIILTASGGAFRDFSAEDLLRMAKEDPDAVHAKATTHPNWDMGSKITVDSATLMNKGLEVIEAHYLFGANYDNIDIVIHPQSIIHSGVETSDSSVLVQMGWPDMRLPILYTMSWPERVRCSEQTWPRLDFFKMGDLTFKEPDRKKYPSVDMAYAAGRAGGTMTGVFSAANEQAVAMFLDKKIGYFDIFRVIEEACDAHRSELILEPTLEDIVHFDGWARKYVEEGMASKA